MAFRESNFAAIWPSKAEMRKDLPGDDLVASVATMERAMTLQATPAEVYRWLQQMGKGRGGFYLSRFVERLLPRKNRALRHLDPLITLKQGDVIEDWADTKALKRCVGRLLRNKWKDIPKPTATATIVVPGETIVFTGQRKNAQWSWCLHLTHVGEDRSRLHMRLRTSHMPSYLSGALPDILDLMMTESFRKGLKERLAPR